MNYSSTKIQKMFIGGLLIFIIILLCVLICLKNNPLPTPGIADKEEISSFISDRDFMRMPEQKRHKFMTDLKQHGILPYMIEPKNPKDREHFRRHMEMFKQERLRKFYSMSPAEQEKALQEAAKEKQEELAYRKNHQDDFNGDLPSHRKELEGQSPEDRARTVDFAKKLKNHMLNNTNKKVSENAQ